MSARETHVTEWGLGACAGLSEDQMGAAGLTYNMRACDRATGVVETTIGRTMAIDKVPTCPRCAVMRDEALEGRLPKR